MECNEESMAAATRYKFRDGFEELLKAQPESTDVDVLISEVAKILVALCVATEVPKLAFLDCVEDMYEDAHQAKITASLLFGGVKNLPDA
jgi:hypothetical protein|tara:strand:+ start:5864 stop:6133 length:270 start_codon:yes stop_codon:yes gene_type:complete